MVAQEYVDIMAARAAEDESLAGLRRSLLTLAAAPENQLNHSPGSARRKVIHHRQRTPNSAVCFATRE